MLKAKFNNIIPQVCILLQNTNLQNTKFFYIKVVLKAMLNNMPQVCILYIKVVLKALLNNIMPRVCIIIVLKAIVLLAHFL